MITVIRIVFICMSKIIMYIKLYSWSITVVLQKYYDTSPTYKVTE